MTGRRSDRQGPCWQEYVVTLLEHHKGWMPRATLVREALRMARRDGHDVDSRGLRVSGQMSSGGRAATKKLAAAIAKLADAGLIERAGLDNGARVRWVPPLVATPPLPPEVIRRALAPYPDSPAPDPAAIAREARDREIRQTWAERPRATQRSWKVPANDRANEERPA